MKRSRFTDEQIAYALRQVDGGTAVADVCRQMGISEATFYVHWSLRSSRLRRHRERFLQVQSGRDESRETLTAPLQSFRTTRTRQR